MTTLITFLVGLGVVLLFAGLTQQQRPQARWRPFEALDRVAAEAGYAGAGGNRLLVSCFVGAAAGYALSSALSSLWTVSAALSAAGFLLPLALARSRRDKLRDALRSAWPDAMADIISGVRAGLSLAECGSALATRGPSALRHGFAAFSVTYAACGSFDAALTRLQDTLEDPVADRVVAVLRMTHEVGGNDIVRVLRTSAELIREDLRIRGEIKARWSWTITAARLAAGAPFAVVLMMSTRPEAAAAYGSSGGTVTILIGSAACLIGYRLMLLAAKMPEERRIR